MSAEVESMMFTGRERPWHGLGTQVEEVPDSREALIAAGLDWDVVQRPVFTQDGVKVTGYFANVRQQDGSILGVVCNNTLNLALNTADRCWSIHHTGDIAAKLEDARETLFMAEDYMNELGKGFEDLSRKRLTDAAVEEYIQELLPVADDASETTEKNILRLRKDMAARYYDAPDLQGVRKNGYRFINAVSDFATHAAPIRRTKNYQETLFNKIMGRNPLTDKAYRLVMAA